MTIAHKTKQLTHPKLIMSGIYAHVETMIVQSILQAFSEHHQLDEPSTSNTH